MNGRVLRQSWCGAAVSTVCGMTIGWWLASRSTGPVTPTTSDAVVPRPSAPGAARTAPHLVAMPPGFEEVSPGSLRDRGSVGAQIRAALALAERCPIQDIPDLLNRLSGFSGRSGLATELLQMALAARWTEAHPYAALEAIRPGTKLPAKGLEPYSILSTLAASRPDLLIAHWEEVKSQLARYDEESPGLIRALLAAAPERAAEIVALVKDDPKLSHAAIPGLWMQDREEAKRMAIANGKVNELLDCWGNENLDEACRWALEHGPKGLPVMKLASWVETQPTEALGYYENEATQDAKNALIRHLSLEIGKDDPSQGIDWLLPQPESREKNMALAQQLVNWLGHDPEAASAWLRDRPDGKERESLVRSFSYAALALDPPMAMEWAATLGDPKTRDQALERNYVMWAREDPETARAWLEGSPAMPEEMVTKLKKGF